MQILEENRKILEQRYKGCIEKLENLSISEKTQLYSAKNGEYVIATERNSKIWYLNSRLDPEGAAEIFAERYRMRIFGTYFVFGLSDGRYIQKLLDKSDKTNQFIIYEPDISFFHLACCSFDLSNLIASERVFLYVPDLIGNINTIIFRAINYLNRTIIEMCILPGYDILYQEQYAEFEDAIFSGVREAVMIKHTKVGMGRKNPQHLLYHMKNIVFHSDCEQLRRKLCEYDLTNIPAIIVSAGPSLDKNVHELKKAQGRSFIIVVDAALRTVIKAGIRPNLVYSLDYKVPDYFFEGIDMDGLIWICEGLTKPWILKQTNSKIFYVGYFCRYYSSLSIKTIGYALSGVPTGGSVSTSAFSVASYLGFKKIILVGQDLAFTSGVSHTKGALGAFGNNSDYIKSRSIVQVESIDGELLDTDLQMWQYKSWFERTIRLNMNEIDVINATEGGANIVGAENRKLCDVVEQECTNSLDIYEIEKSIPQAFNEKQREEVLLQLYNMKELVANLRDKIHDAIKQQENILKSLEHNSLVDIKEKLMNMLNVNEEIGKHVLLELVKMYISKEEYESGEKVFIQEDMEINEIVQNNQKLFQEYLTGIEMLEEDIDEYIIKDD